MVCVSLQQILMGALVLVYTALPHVASRDLWSSLRSLSSLDRSSENDRLAALASISKRDGADTFSICDHGAPMSECFDRYMSMYARMRNQVLNRPDSATRRNIGKRTYNNVGLPAMAPAELWRSLCPDNYSNVQCASFLIASVLESFDLGIEVGNDVI